MRMSKSEVRNSQGIIQPSSCMIICSWNISKLNKVFKQKEFKLFLVKNKIDLVGCFETRVKTNKVNHIQSKLGVGWSFVTNYNYASNGRI